METMVQQGQLRWMDSVQRMSGDRLVKKMYKAKISGRRKRGRLRKAWNDEIRTAAEKRGIKWRDIPKLARNREGWRKKWRRLPDGTQPYIER